MSSPRYRKKSVAMAFICQVTPDTTQAIARAHFKKKGNQKLGGCLQKLSDRELHITVDNGYVCSSARFSLTPFLAV